MNAPLRHSALTVRHWSDAYGGRPAEEFGDLPCWGLAREVFKDRCNIALPDYAGRVGREERAEIAALFSDGARRFPWREVVAGEEREFDLALFLRAGLPQHVGIVTEPGRMLHVLEDGLVQPARYDSGRWKCKLAGLYRHAALAGEALRVRALPRLLDPSERIDLTLPPGSTLAEVAAAAFPGLPPERHRLLRIFVDDESVPAIYWQRVRPKACARVTVRLMVGNDTLRTVLTVVVAIAAIVTGQLYLGPLLAGTFGLSSATWAGITGVIGTLAGNLLINALIPVRPALGDSSGGGSPTYSIQGWKNVATPDKPIPAVTGLHRVAPVYAALPYSEVIGDDLYVISLFLFGYGPLDISNIRIGETPIDTFSGVQYELRNGYASDEPVSLYPQQVIEDSLQNDLKYNEPTSRTTPSDVTESSVDFFFPQGLLFANDGGDVDSTFVNFLIEQRVAGSGDAWSTVTTLSVSAATKNPVRRSYRWTHPERGTWEIQITRQTTDHNDDLKFSSQSIWSAVRSFRPEYPVNFDKPLALLAVRVKASEQLQGILDNLNADCALLCDSWDGSEWVPLQQTSNPADIYRWMLQGPAAPVPQTDDEVGLTDLQAWSAFNTSKGLAYNRVHDFESSWLDAMADCCAAGRASPRDSGTQWTVTVDNARTIVDGHLTPRNSRDFSWERSYARLPDAYRVKFKNETDGYADAEMIVPFPNFTDTPQIVEDLDLPGITLPALIWKETRRRQYELTHRPDSFTCTQDFEVLEATRGDMLKLNHDVLIRAQVAGRVLRVAGQGIVLDTRVTMDADKSYAARIRVLTDDGESSLLRSVRTVGGETDTLWLRGDMTGIEEGCLVMFGESGSESIEVIVKEVEAGDDLSARLTCVAHAPEIEALVDAESPPAFTGRYGTIIEFTDIAPNSPLISAIVSGDSVVSLGVSLQVQLAPDPTGVVPTTFEVDHRLHGGGAYTTISAPVAAGVINVSGYSAGDQVDIVARAKNAAGTPSADTDVTTYTVLATSAPPAPTLSAPTEAGGTVTIDLVMPNSANLKSAHVYRGDTDVFADMTQIATVFGTANQTLSTTDTPGTGTWYYRVTAENASGIVGDPSAAQSITLT